MLSDVVRFAIGTFTAIPVRAPSRVDRRVAGFGLLAAPVAALPLGLLTALVLWGGREFGLAPLAVAATAVAVLALGSRGFHLDGLADTADGLTASYDREHALAVMRTGDVGPAGAAALVLTLGTQVVASAHLLGTAWGPLLVGALVCASRVAPATMSVRGVPPARPDGLGAATAGSVHPVAAVVLWLVLAAALAGAVMATGAPWWRGPVCAAAGLVAIVLLTARAVRRLGGVTGDVYGAGVEVSLAVTLLVVT